MDTELPPCSIVTPDGRRADVVASSTDTVDDLASALGADRSSMILIDGRAVARDVLLVDSGLRRGSSIALAPFCLTARRPPTDGADGAIESITDDRAIGAEVAVTAGPACSPWRTLGAGRHVLGRASSASISIADPSVEAHHAIVEVGPSNEPDGVVVGVTQLAGRTPIEGDGCETSTRDLVFGTSTVSVRVRHGGETPHSTASRSPARSAGDPWRWQLHRSPRRADVSALPFPSPPTVPAARRGPATTGLVGAAVAAGGAAVIATVMDQVLFVVFALVGAVVSLATWVGGWIAVVIQRRRDHRRHGAEVAAFVAEVARRRDAAELVHRAMHPSIVEALTALDDYDRSARTVGVVGVGGGVWQRRRGAGEPLSVTCGRGTVSWPGANSGIGAFTSSGGSGAGSVEDFDVPTLDDVEVPIPLAPGTVTALHGDDDQARASMRSLVVQLATWYGPVDWRLVAVVTDSASWDWLRWLPHTTLLAASTDDDVEQRLLQLRGAEDDRSAGSTATRCVTVVFTDHPSLLVSRTGPLRRLLGRTDALGLVLVPHGDPVPSVADRVVEISSTGTVTHGLDDGVARAAGVTQETAARAARQLAPLVDPECEHEAGLPEQLGLGALGVSAADAVAVATRWTATPGARGLRAPIGLATDGVVEIDLVHDGPHALIAGTTGSGKSELLRTLIAGLAVTHSPDEVTFVLVDFKGGATFDACAQLPHTVGLVTDLDGGLVRRALVSLDAEIGRRERLLRAAGAEDLESYRERCLDDPGVVGIPRLVVVIDEFASLATDHPDLMSALVAVAQRGRSLGIHLVLATQRPAGVVTDDIRANTNIRIALRLQGRADAVDVIGDAAPAAFPRHVPGRAAVRLGSDDLVVFQAAGCTGARRDLRDGVTIARSPLESRVAGGASEVDGRAGHRGSELDELVSMAGEAVMLAEIAPPFRPWLEPLRPVLERADLPHDDQWADAVGVIDDVTGQARRPLRWDTDSGNLLLVGSLGSGLTSTAATIITGLVRGRPPAERHVYVIDAFGDPTWDPFDALAHVGAVVRSHETERLVRLVTRLAADLDRRAADRCTTPAVVLVVDGLEVLRAALASIDHADASGSFDRIVGSGPAMGITVCATSSGAPSASSFDAHERWLFHSDETGASRAVGLGTAVAPAVSGRLVVASTLLHAQVIAPRPIVADPVPAGTGGPPPIEVLPARVMPRDLDGLAPRPSSQVVGDDVTDLGTDVDELQLDIGIAALDLGVASIVVPSGDHVLVTGTSRTGVSTAVRAVVRAWQRRMPDGALVVVGRTGAGVGERVAAALEAGRPVLVAVDDADRIDDGADLATLAAGRDPRIILVAGVRLESARVAYGHWVREVARRRCGVILTSAGEVDGELLGVVLPRRTLMPPRPGLGWIVDRRGVTLAQLVDCPSFAPGD